MFFASVRLYLQDASTIADRICRIEAIIDQLIITIAAAALDEPTSEYRLNDGQTIIHAGKRSVKQMVESLEGLETILQIYQNKYNGRSVRLVDHESTRLLTTVLC